MNRFKYTVGPGFWREYTQLFPDLDGALMALDDHAKIGLVPAGHAPWKPFIGRPANETTPFRAEVIGRPWEVVNVFSYRDGEKSEWFIAEFVTAGDAFAFAEMKTKMARERQDTSNTFFVCLRGWTEDGRRPELARLPHDHLAKLWKSKRRAEESTARVRVARCAH